MNLSKSDIIRIAYCGRLFLRTDREYLEVVGVSGPTFRKNVAAGVDVERYYTLLDRECRRLTNSALDEAVMSYVNASEMYLNTDWGARSDSRARRRFCRLLFRLGATVGMEIPRDERERLFRSTDSDKGLLKLFYTDGFDNGPVVNMAYIILFAFGIVRPWEPRKERGFDLTDEEIRGCLVKLRELLWQLREDLPRIGAFERAVAFDQWDAILENHLGKPELFGNCVPVGLMNALNDVGNACISILDPESAAKSAQSMIPIYLPGIWVDDTDDGETRFWVFPFNVRCAFCYHRHMNGWELTPYEFTGQDTEDRHFSNSCYFVTHKGSAALIKGIHDASNIKEMAHAGYQVELSSENGEPVGVEFYRRSLAMPEWFDWNAFRRLSRDDERYKEFRGVLKMIYTPGNPFSATFHNNGAEMTNVLNNFVARDFETLYVWDYPLPDRFFIDEVERDCFVYANCYLGAAPSFSLRRMEISEEHPLYAIPLKRREREDGINSAPGGEEERKMREARLDHLEKVLREAVHINVVSIFHFKVSPHPILLFPELASTFPLDMSELEEFGVERITSRHQLLEG